MNIADDVRILMSQTAPSDIKMEAVIRVANQGFIDLNRIANALEQMVQQQDRDSPL